ncbi:MAG TPA: hypothetical protein PKV91_07250 [Bacillota bacterium]|jgi:hypothetical protein|nr:hypothetical protein [Bacillota bacterium]HOJ83413.1 hypothetical protein [Bacillota bacterium]HOL14650.1 hypothetical protein [Bacillota bacterium]HPZ12137.1 hypothetical protein [Bacillota bacterium]HQE09712.1 hypothetical protein [Bacillota bacterium]
MQAIYRNKFSKIIPIIFLFTSLIQIFNSLRRNDYIFLGLWAVLAAVFLALLILTIIQPYVVLTASTIKIRQTPFSMREYRLDRLQFDKKGIELTYFTYTGQKGEEETVKLSHLILDQKDMDTIKAAIEKAGSSAENF